MDSEKSKSTKKTKMVDEIIVSESPTFSVEELLMAALMKAKEDEEITRNTTLTRSIGTLINVNFKNSREGVKRVMKPNVEMFTNDPSPSSTAWQVYQNKPNNNQTKKKVEKIQKSSPAVGNSISTTEDLESTLESTLEQISTMTPQQVLEKFGSIGKLKDWCKEIGLDDLDHTAEPMDFIQDLITSLGGGDEV